MKLIRRLLILAVLMFAYSAAVMAYLVPYFGFVVLAVGVLMACRRGAAAYTAFGEARWATTQDLILKGMIHED